MEAGTDGLRNKNAQVLISDVPTILFLDDDLILSQFFSDLFLSDDPGSRPSSYHPLTQRHFATTNGPRNVVGITSTLYGYLFDISLAGARIRYYLYVCPQGPEQDAAQPSTFDPPLDQDTSTLLQ